jgi:nucleoid-associated protein EbfC
MAGSLGDLGGLLKQAQKMQRQVAELQEELSKKTFEGRAGGGMVLVVVNGKREFVSIKINPQVIDPEDAEILEDLIAVAFRDALSQAEKASETAMGGVTGGLGLPGMM